MGIRDDLKKQALTFSQKAMDALMADEKRAMQIADAVGKVQQGKKVLEKGQEDVLRGLNFATKGDFKSIGKQFSTLKRRVRELDEKLEELVSKR